MSIILSFPFTCKLKICIILKATQHLDSFIGCKWDFSVFWWPSIEIYGHMYLTKIMFLLPSKRKHTVLHSLSEDWICFLFYIGGPFESSKCLSSGLSLQWKPLTQLDSPTIFPNIHREICTRLIWFESYSVPTFLIWS